jgi:hypothetical protein
MALEKLDMILLISGAVLAVISIIVNIVSVSRLSGLSEAVSQFENKFESKTTQENRPGEGDSPDEKMEASTETGSDTRTGTRYRAPSARTERPSQEPAEEGAGSMPPMRHAGIAKAGVRLPPEEPAAEAERAVAEEAQTEIPAEPEKAHTSRDREMNLDLLAGVERLNKEEQALLADYLLKSAMLSARKPPVSSPETTPSASEASAAAEPVAGEDPDADVMEVVEDAPSKPSGPASASSEDEPVEINPFDHVQHKIDMKNVFEALKGMKKGRPLLIDFQDVLFLIEEEAEALEELSRYCEKYGVPLAVKNVQANIRNDLHSQLPLLRVV